MTEEGYLTLVSGKGREKQIYLTEKGEKITEEKILPIINAENEAFHHMSAKAPQILLDLLEEYITRLDTTMMDIPSDGKERA